MAAEHQVLNYLRTQQAPMIDLLKDLVRR